MLFTNVPPEAEFNDKNNVSFGFRVMAIPMETVWKVQLQNYVELDFVVDVELRFVFFKFNDYKIWWIEWNEIIFPIKSLLYSFSNFFLANFSKQLKRLFLVVDINCLFFIFVRSEDKVFSIIVDMIKKSQG